MKRIAHVSFVALTSLTCINSPVYGTTSFGSIHGHVLIGEKQEPVAFTESEGVFVVVHAKTYNDVIEQDLSSLVDSSGYYSIDSIPPGIVTVYLDTDLPPLPLHKVSIEPGADIEVNFELAPHTDGGKRGFGFDYGVREAQQMWNMGLASVRYRSGFDDNPQHNVDLITGLPKIGLQDQNYQFGIGFVDGFNSTTKNLIEQYGLPANSQETWLNIFEDIPNYFESQKALGRVDTAWKYGLAVFSPDSTYFYMSGQTFRSDLYRKDLILSNDNEKFFSEIVWGPPGSNFFIEKNSGKYWNDPSVVAYKVCDFDNWKSLFQQINYNEVVQPSSPIGESSRTFGVLTGTITIGTNRRPIGDEQFQFPQITNDSNRVLARKEIIANLWTDSLGHFYVDSVRGDMIVTLLSRENYLPVQSRKITRLSDTSLQINFTCAPNFTGNQYDFGIVRGAKRARRDWMVNRAVFLYTKDVDGALEIDLKSGLPATPAGRANDYGSGFVTGYNAVIDSLIMEHGYPPNSRKRWLPIITEPESYFETQAALGNVDTLWRFGKPVFSPDSSLFLRYGIDRWIHTYSVVKQDRDTLIPYNNVDDFRLIVWGPPGARFYVEKQFLRSYNVFGHVGYIVREYDDGDDGITLNRKYTTSL